MKNIPSVSRRAISKILLRQTRAWLACLDLLRWIKQPHGSRSDGLLKKMTLVIFGRRLFVLVPLADDHVSSQLAKSRRVTVAAFRFDSPL